MLTPLAAIGGTFFLLTFNHFVADWVFQTAREAGEKATNWRLRALHCSAYTVLMSPLICLLLPLWWAVGAVALVWMTHFGIDTYWPVYLWLKHIRRDDRICKTGSPHKWYFRSIVQNDPFLTLLFIVGDQILHLIPLLLVAVAALAVT
jgi:hypothetical protein